MRQKSQNSVLAKGFEFQSILGLLISVLIQNYFSGKEYTIYLWQQSRLQMEVFQLDTTCRVLFINIVEGIPSR